MRPIRQATASGRRGTLATRSHWLDGRRRSSCSARDATTPPPVDKYSVDIPAGVTDQRARFREIFCAVLASARRRSPDYRPCNRSLDAHRGRARGHGHAGGPRAFAPPPRGGHRAGHRLQLLCPLARLAGQRGVPPSPVRLRPDFDRGWMRCRAPRPMPARSAMPSWRGRRKAARRGSCSPATPRAARTFSRPWSVIRRFATASLRSSTRRVP